MSTQNEKKRRDFEIASSVATPALWLETLAFVESLETLEPIRVLTFRRGLNIIATAADEDAPGHDVGKTLTTRLIRYLFGEGAYGSPDVERAVVKRYPQGGVVGKVYVRDRAWIVGKPFAKKSENTVVAPFAFLGEDWREAGNVERRDAYRFFLDALNGLVDANFDDARFPENRRRVEWLDLLAWLTRDQALALRDVAVWRVKDADAGASNLSQSDAHFLLRLTLDALDQEEKRELLERKELQKTREQERLVFNELGNKLDVLFELFQQTSPEFKDAAGDGGCRELFLKAATERIERKLETLNEIYDRPRVKTPEQEREFELTGSAENLRGQIAALRSQADAEETGVAQGETSSSDNDTIDEMLRIAASICSRPDCELKKKPPREVAAPLKAERIAARKSRIDELNRDIERLNVELEEKVVELNDLAETTRSQTKAQEAESRALYEKIIALKVLLRQFVECQRIIARQNEIERNLTRIDNELKCSGERLKVLRDRYELRLERLSRSFQSILDRLFKDERKERGATYRLKIDGAGLQIVKTNGGKSFGEATKSALVLALDWTACLESVAGRGFFPRFFIHDSPREADRDLKAYRRLFELAKEMEDAFDGAEPSFQYIVSTTTAPPQELGQEPFLRCELRAEAEEGLALKFPF